MARMLLDEFGSTVDEVNNVSTVFTTLGAVGGGVRLWSHYGEVTVMVVFTVTGLLRQHQSCVIAASLGALPHTRVTAQFMLTLNVWHVLRMLMVLLCPCAHVSLFDVATHFWLKLMGRCVCCAQH